MMGVFHRGFWDNAGMHQGEEFIAAECSIDYKDVVDGCPY